MGVEHLHSPTFTKSPICMLTCCILSHSHTAPKLAHRAHTCTCSPPHLQTLARTCAQYLTCTFSYSTHTLARILAHAHTLLTFVLTHTRTRFLNHILTHSAQTLDRTLARPHSHALTAFILSLAYTHAFIERPHSRSHTQTQHTHYGSHTSTLANSHLDTCKLAHIAHTLSLAHFYTRTLAHFYH